MAPQPVPFNSQDLLKAVRRTVSNSGEMITTTLDILHVPTFKPSDIPIKSSNNTIFLPIPERLPPDIASKLHETLSMVDNRG